jgi:methionyl-tRNA formyltransferase
VRIIFMGSPDEAVVSLNALAKAGHDIVAVVTRPDRPKGRGRRPVPPPVRPAAEALGITCRQPEDVNDESFCSSLRSHDPELLVVVAFGAILRAELLTLAPRGAVNLHFSLLPALRGASPVEWALLRGCRETGVTTIFMSEKVDAGDVIQTRSTPIDPEETAGELRGRLSHIGAEVLAETVGLLEAGGKVPVRPQDHTRRSRAPRITCRQIPIDWTRDARAIHNQVRALNPRPGAAAEFRGIRIKVWRTRVMHETGSTGAVGEILTIAPEGPVVACGEGAVILRELQEPGKRTVPGDAFTRGRRLKVGERLTFIPPE